MTQADYDLIARILRSVCARDSKLISNDAYRMIQHEFSASFKLVDSDFDEPAFIESATPTSYYDATTGERRKGLVPEN